MTKADMLRIIKLLSALESWCLSTQSKAPDYLFEEIGQISEVLEKELLK